MNHPRQPMNRRQFLKATTQATATMAAFAGLGGVAAPLIARAGEAARPRASRISYYCDGRIHVGEPGQPEGKPLTQDHWDFKPSWSKTGGFYVMQGKVGGKPGEEVALTDDRFHTWAHSCLRDGRILVNALHPTRSRN